MSLWLSARLPDIIGSASAFNPGPEFFAGDKGSRVLWRPKDHVANHGETMIRLIRASGDYISQYHEETREAYARSDVDFEFRQDEYHRHWATSIGETFEFHMRAFDNPTLNNHPESWSHASPYQKFAVWGYEVESAGDGAALTYLTDVRQGGFRVTTRKWAPDGPAALRKITIRTAPLYSVGKAYTILDHNLGTGESSRRQVIADKAGRLTLPMDGQGHEVSIAGLGTGAQPPIVMPLTSRDVLRTEPANAVEIPLRIYNPRSEPMREVKVKIASEYPTVEVITGEATIREIPSGGVSDLSRQMRVKLTGGSGYFAPASFTVVVTYDGWKATTKSIPILISPDALPAPAAMQILDGRTVTLNVFRQKGNQGGGSSVQRTVTEGRGNGNGILEPGEDATIWVQIPQGMDAFDKNNWYRTKVHPQSSMVTEIADIEEQKQLEWTGAQERTSLIRLSGNAPSGAALPLILENETWSYHFTPDVRYGKEKLYQAFQLHTRRLHKIELTVPIRPLRNQTN